jgi:hypothetical protein
MRRRLNRMATSRRSQRRWGSRYTCRLRRCPTCRDQRTRSSVDAFEAQGRGTWGGGGAHPDPEHPATRPGNRGKKVARGARGRLRCLSVAPRSCPAYIQSIANADTPPEPNVLGMRDAADGCTNHHVR